MRIGRVQLPARLATRMSLGTLAVALLAIGVLAVGVLIIARSSFAGLMIQAGASTAEAQGMFDRGVAEIFAIAVGVAVIVSAVLSVVIAVRLARPLDDISFAARRVAAGDYDARVPRGGPTEVTSLADSFNQMALSLADQERVRRDFIVNAAHELRNSTHQPPGLLGGDARRRHPSLSRPVHVTARRGRSPRPPCSIAELVGGSELGRRRTRRRRRRSDPELARRG